MSSVIERWCREHEDQGHYAAFCGFEADVRANEGITDIYDKLNVFERIVLFGFVVGLLEEERDKASKSRCGGDA